LDCRKPDAAPAKFEQVWQFSGVYSAKKLNQRVLLGSEIVLLLLSVPSWERLTFPATTGHALCVLAMLEASLGFPLMQNFASLSKRGWSKGARQMLLKINLRHALTKPILRKASVVCER
jgi:hypothetical protein